MGYKIESNHLTLSNGYSLDFEYPIKSTLIIQDVIVILVESPFRVIYNKNVFAIKTSGDFLWRIGDVDLYYRGTDCPYVEIRINEDNELILFNWCDTVVVIDPQTGAVLRTWITH